MVRSSRLIFARNELFVAAARSANQFPVKSLIQPSALLVELMTPMTLEVSLSVQDQLDARFVETDALRRQHIERTRMMPSLLNVDT